MSIRIILLFLANIAIGKYVARLDYLIRKISSKEMRCLTDAIKGNILLSSVIAEDRELQPIAPSQYRSLCSFHTDSNPSMSVSDEPGLYFCFSCGAAGDVVRYIEKTRKKSYIDSLQTCLDIISKEDPQFEAAVQRSIDELLLHRDELLQTNLHSEPSRRVNSPVVSRRVLVNNRVSDVELVASPVPASVEYAALLRVLEGRRRHLNHSRATSVVRSPFIINQFRPVPETSGSYNLDNNSNRVPAHRREAMKPDSRSQEEIYNDLLRARCATQVLSCAAAYYTHRLLNDPQAEFVRRYLKERKISLETAMRFQIGYAPLSCRERRRGMDHNNAQQLRTNTAARSNGVEGASNIDKMMGPEKKWKRIESNLDAASSPHPGEPKFPDDISVIHTPPISVCMDKLYKGRMNVSIPYSETSRIRQLTMAEWLLNTPVRYSSSVSIDGYRRKARNLSNMASWVEEDAARAPCSNQLLFTPADFVDAGLLLEGRYSTKVKNINNAVSSNYYERFRNRLMFPIRTVDGAVAGFGARILPSDSTTNSSNRKPMKRAPAKYTNSPNTVVFRKGSMLFGIDLALPFARFEDAIILVEGYLDVISLHEIGIKNVVATLGTAITIDQLSLAASLTDSGTVVLLLDNDEAGVVAAERARERLVKFVRQRQRVADGTSSIGHPVTAQQIRLLVAELNQTEKYIPADDTGAKDRENRGAGNSDCISVKDCSDVLMKFGRTAAPTIMTKIIKSAKVAINTNIPVTND